MKKKTLLIVIAILCALLLTACGCKHEWADATCTAPKTCNLCGEQEGEALDHAEGELVLVHIEMANMEGTYERRCAGCDIALDEETKTLNALHEDGKFLLTIAEFKERADNFFAASNLAITTEICVNNDNVISCDFSSYGESAGSALFYDDDYCLVDADSENRKNYNTIRLTMGMENFYTSAMCLAGAMSAVSIDGDGTMDALTALGEGSTFAYEGIRYEMGMEGLENLSSEEITADAIMAGNFYVKITVAE